MAKLQTVDLTISNEPYKILVKKPGEDIGVFNSLCPGKLSELPNMASILLAVREGEAFYAGGILCYSTDREGGEAFISHLFVDERFRGEGYGELLLEKLDEEAASQGLMFEVVDTSDDSTGEKMRSYLEDMEFVFEEAFRPEYRVPVGSIRDIVGTKDYSESFPEVVALKDIPRSMLNAFLEELDAGEKLYTQPSQMQGEISYGLVKEGRMLALMMVSNFPVGEVRLNLVRRRGADISRDLPNLLRCVTSRLIRTFVSEQDIRIVVHRDDLKAMIHYLFPEAMPYLVLRGTREIPQDL